ncbi:MAG: DNA-processing protein DprA [Micrococcales bacterium]|nr:DNA-processing protein DprA [Micrococcales bacterium]
MNAERQARAVWTVIAEPGDPVAGELVAWVGADRALTWVRSVGRGRADWSVLEGPEGGVLEGPEGTVLGAAVRRRLVRRGQTWARRLDAASLALDGAARAVLDLVVPGDPHWPTGLDDLGTAAPHALWLRGSLSASSVLAPVAPVALVGARACTAYGQRVASELADGLVARGAVVVSGGAYGIDAAVHRGALTGGATWAVLAGGLDRDYPAGHRALFAQIVASGGALLGEAPPGAVPARHRFLQRNRLIAALTAGTVVVEAAWRSGALSTANHAAGLLRPVGAVPGPVTSAASAGCHRLLREGTAVCVTDAEEVVDLVGPIGTRPVGTGMAAAGVAPTDRSTPLDRLDDGARAVHDALSVRTPTTTVELVVRTGHGASAVRAALGRLDLAGLVERDGEGWRAVRPLPDSSDGGARPDRAGH